MPMKVSDYINSFLVSRDIKYVFELSGGMITHLLDSMNKGGNLKIISMRHEQSAAFAADVVGRLSGKPGVALATSGPGATNLITGIGSSYFDSSPTLFITGQVNRNEIKGNRPIRQLGFQETDIVSITKNITKASWQIKDENQIPKFFHKAYDLATSKRRGPILLDIPMDVQRSEIQLTPIKLPNHQKYKVRNTTFIKNLLLSIKKSKKPLILAGGGVQSSLATELFRKAVHMLKIPVVNSLMAVDVLPYTDQFRVGLIGSYGNRWANLALANSDFVLVLGSRLDVRQTGSRIKEFKSGKTIFHVDCDAGEMNNRITGCIELNSNLDDFLFTLTTMVDENNFSIIQPWMDKIHDLKKTFPDIMEQENNIGINPNKLMHSISKYSTLAKVFVTDVGQHQMWAAQSLELDHNQRFITSGGMGSMGFGLPASIGAAFCVAPSPVVLIAGDGGFQTNSQELQTVIHHNLPIKMIILNNNCHGMVRQFQEDLFEKRYQSTLWGYSAPNFEKLANAYGIKSKRISSENQINASLKWLWTDPSRPMLLEVMVNTYTNAYPKISFGQPNYEMYPKKNINTMLK